MQKRTAILFLLFLSLGYSAKLANANETKVNFWHVGTHDEAKALEKIAEKFHKKTGISVHVQPIPWGSFATKYLTAMASGEPPDAGTSSLSAAVEYGKVGGVIDIGQNFPEEAANLKKLIFPDMWPTCYFRNHLFGIPFSANALVGFYRKDIFEELNIKAPATWSELKHVLDVLTSNSYQYGFLWTRNAQWGLGTFVWPYDERNYNKDGTELRWASPDFLKGYKFAIDLWNSYNLVIDKPIELMSIKDDKKALPLFFDYDIRYSEIIIRTPHLKDKFGIFPFPQADDGIPTTIMGGRVAVIFREGKQQQAAMKWIEYLMSKESQLFQYRQLSNMGERSQLILSPNMEFWKEDLGLLPGHQELFYEIFTRLKSVPAFPWTQESDRVLDRTFFKMKEALKDYSEDVASQYDMSIFELKKLFAGGEMVKERQKYYAFLEQTCKEVLAKSHKQAQPKLESERANYYKYYGKYLDTIIESTDKWDILDYSKLIVFILIIVFFIYVFINKHARKSLASYIYITPPVVAALIFIVIPIIVSLYLSFTKYNPVMPLNHATWVGLENYILILKDNVLWQSLGRSLYFAILALPIQLIMAVILAACLDKNLIPDRLYKFVYFSPLVTSIVSVSLIWFALYSGTSYGWINSLLLKLHLIKDPLMFLNDKGLFLNSVIIMSIWQGLAFTILIFLAGFQNISNEQYEASSIDGAGPVKQFFYISLPNLKPQFTFLLIMGTIGAIQVFEQIYMLGVGAGGEAESKFGPDDSGMTIVPFLYRKGFEFFKMGEASAIAYILFILLFILTYFNLKLITKKE